ncbi:unnamed protein product [Sympodiomycopsis kandeliae]
MTSPRASPLPSAQHTQIHRLSSSGLRHGITEGSSSERPSTGSLLPPGPGPIFSKRARQIQEENALAMSAASPYSSQSSSGAGSHRPSSFIGDNYINDFLSHVNGDRFDGPEQPNRGRARAGTLPSSWLGQDQPSGTPDGHGSSRYAEHLQVGSHIARSGASSPTRLSDAMDRTDQFDPHAAFGRSDNSSSGFGLAGGARGPNNRSGAHGPSHLSSEVSSSLLYPGAQDLNASLASRLRSGSLASGLQSDPFGPGIFSAWSEDAFRPTSSALPSRANQPTRGRGATIANTSGGDASTWGNPALDSIDQGIRTLDYLGLEDPQIGDMDPVGNRSAGLAGRDRATTLASATSRPRFGDFLSASRADSPSNDRWQSTSGGSRGGEAHREHPPSTSSAHFGHHGGLAQSSLQQRLGDDFGQSFSSAAGRARAISVGMLDAPSGSMDATQSHSDRHSAFSLVQPNSQSEVTVEKTIAHEDLLSYAMNNGLDPQAFMRAATSAGVTVTPSQSSQPSDQSRQINTRIRAGTVAALGGAGGRMRTEQELMRMSSSHATPMNNRPSLPPKLYVDDVAVLPPSPRPTVQAASAAVPTGGGHATLQLSRASNAGSNNGSQQPTRSLWIGNLGASTTGQELMQAFASYGAIESLRLLPEKECGFVNFVDIEDAVRAREDVMTRLAGRIKASGTGPNGTVRIGFGKIDTPLDSTQIHPGSSSTTPSAQTGKFRSNSPAAGHGGNLASDRDDNMPTRALWVGSIPNTTTPAALLSLFQPYGPIESARVLTHKNCGFINFERVDDAVRARKMLNGRDLLGSEVGAVRIGFAKIPSRGAEDVLINDPSGDGLSEILPALDHLKGASAIPAEHQALSGGLENYRSNLVVDLLSKQQQHRQNSQHQPQPPYASESPAHRSASQMPAVPSHTSMAPLSLTYSHSASNSGLSASNSIVPSSDKGGVPLPTEMQPRATSTELQLIMKQLSQGEDQEDLNMSVSAVRQLRPPTTYYTSIPMVSESNSPRRFDATKLREVRKTIEQGQSSQAEVDNLAKGYLDNIVDLSSDYIGNTVVQKFFDLCSEPVKTAMLERIAPTLASIGIHKNGTWAAQKMIDMSQMPEQRTIIAHNVKPYLPPLLLDQFGNYVVQCLLPYGAHTDPSAASSESDFIFDSIVDRCWEIAQGRFGARSVRACLESKHASRLQRKKVAISIILNAVPLTTSPNGALLLTWLLDASDLPNRFELLAPRFTPHLTHLCTHKLASQTVLRVVNQNSEPEASQKILDALFNSPDDAILEEVLTDQVHGSQFVTKVLSSSHLDAGSRDRYAEQVKRIVSDQKLVTVPAYRKLVEDLGMPFVPAPSASTNGPLIRMAHPPMGQSAIYPDMAQGLPSADLNAAFNQMGIGTKSNSLPPAPAFGMGMPRGNKASPTYYNESDIHRYDDERLARDSYSQSPAMASSRASNGAAIGRAGGVMGPKWGGWAPNSSDSSGGPYGVAFEGGPYISGPHPGMAHYPRGDGSSPFAGSSSPPNLQTAYGSFHMPQQPYNPGGHHHMQHGHQAAAPYYGTGWGASGPMSAAHPFNGGYEG